MDYTLQNDGSLPPVKKAIRRPLSPTQWREQKKIQTERAKRQMEGFESAELFKATIESKLLRAGCHERWFKNFRRCGVEKFIVMCPNCANVEEQFYQCSNKICPRCNWRIANARRRLLEKITAGMFGTKHIVLTQKNFSTGLKDKIRDSRKNLLKLRKQKIFGKVLGGCASMEITNEKKGWHLHWHLLVNSTVFVSGENLAIAWGKLVGQEFAIVKVKAVEEGSYLQEICKYAAKGSDIAKWTPEQIYEFADACAGTRMFTVFGNFAGMRKHAAKLVKLDKLKATKKICSCGCDVKVFGATESDCHQKIQKGYF